MNKTRSIRNLAGISIFEDRLPAMSFSMYVYELIYKNRAFLEEFLRLYLSLFNSMRTDIGRGALWQVINAVRGLNEITGLRNNFRVGKFRA